MKRKINWIRVILIMGLAFTFVGVHFVFTFYSLLYDNFEYLVDLMVKKGVLESIIGVFLFLAVMWNTTVKDIKKGLQGLTLYVVIVTFFLVLGVATGVLMQDALHGLFRGVFEELSREAEKFGSIPSYQQAIFLFGNNSRVAVISGILAFFPGLGALWPLGVLGLNGVVIGLAPAVFEMEYSMFLIAILPHGILEIPALILASAVGVKFSIYTLKAVLGFLFPPEGVPREVQFLQEVKPGWQAVKLFAVIIPMLAAAALIEAFITPWVMELFGI